MRVKTNQNKQTNHQNKQTINKTNKTNHQNKQTINKTNKTNQKTKQTKSKIKIKKYDYLGIWLNRPFRFVCNTVQTVVYFIYYGSCQLTHSNIRLRRMILFKYVHSQTCRIKPNQWTLKHLICLFPRFIQITFIDSCIH